MKFIIMILFIVSLHQPSSYAGEQWVTHWVEYQNAGGTTELRGQSSRTCLSEIEALHEASRDAALQMLELLSLPRTDDRISRLSNQIVQGRMIKRRAVERIDKSYGTLWQVSLLIDASPESLESLRMNIERDVRKIRNDNRQRRAAFIAISLAATFGIGLFCFLANFFTRGYFTWRLRLASLAAMILAIGGIHALI